MSLLLYNERLRGWSRHDSTQVLDLDLDLGQQAPLRLHLLLHRRRGWGGGAFPCFRLRPKALAEFLCNVDTAESRATDPGSYPDEPDHRHTDICPQMGSGPGWAPRGVPSSISPKRSFKKPRLSAMFCLVKKQGSVWEPQTHMPVATSPDAQGARRFARAWAQEWPEGRGARPLLQTRPSSARTNGGGENRTGLPSLLKKNLILRFGAF